MSRTLEEVQATIQIAKLKENDLHNTSHCLTFGESVSSGDYCLMELDDTLCKHIEAGKSLVIRGDQDERAVLCSEDKTYDLKIADTSNLLLLVPGCLTPDQLTTDNQASSQLVHAQIWGFSNSYWELRKRHPKLKKLKRLLMENPYEGPGISGQEDVTEGKYTMGDLLERIQASEEELEAQLQTIHACDVNGYWRLLDFDYEMKLLGHITQLVDSESWSFSKVPLRVSLEELGRLEPQEMIEHSFNCYGRRYTDNDEVFFALNEDKVCRATAQMLLQNAAKFNLAEFQEVWQQSVPDGMGTRLDQLKVRMGSDWQLRGMGTRLDQLKVRMGSDWQLRGMGTRLDQLKVRMGSDWQLRGMGTRLDQLKVRMRDFVPSLRLGCFSAHRLCMYELHMDTSSPTREVDKILTS
ncbi:sister chromatid cohesion protein DCC1-like isoform X6 [Oncorhynchus keta]|uniref:sister chromatid cohesion protein DCC1-like isoform X6 n=1 Tax=Oncorhynchus keta TaxID=8018 RepID=UPI00227A3A3E|nr:sister chromatid cohesion protein DCC1-like isoform X6 [Oncorhynchus keta]